MAAPENRNSFQQYLCYAGATVFEWYFTLGGLVLIACLPVILGQGQGAESLNPVDLLKEMSTKGDQTKQIILLGLYIAFTFLLLLRTQLRTLQYLGIPLLLLTAWCAATAAWSVNSDVTVRRFVALLGTIMLGAFLGLRFDMRNMLRIITLTAVIALSLSLVLAVVTPSLGLDFDGRLRGVFEHKNAIGDFSAIALLAAVAQFGRGFAGKFRAATNGLVAALSLVCMVLARSTGVVPVLAAAFACTFVEAHAAAQGVPV